MNYKVADFIGLYPVFVIKNISKVKVEFLEDYKVRVDNHIGYLYPSQYQKLMNNMTKEESDKDKNQID